MLRPVLISLKVLFSAATVVLWPVREMSPYRMKREENLMYEFVFRALLLIELSCISSSSHDTGKATLILDVVYVLVLRPGSYELNGDRSDKNVLVAEIILP